MHTLTGDQINRLHAAILGNFSDVNLDLQLLRPLKGFALDDIVGSNLGRIEQIHALINVAERDHWLLPFLELADTVRSDVATFRELLEEIHDTPLYAPGINPITHTLVFSRDQPILDRDIFRAQLERLDQDLARCLVVNGPPGSGKTYSKRLIFHLQRVRGFEVILLDFKRHSEVLTAHDLGRLIALEMGLGEPPAHESETAARWGHYYVSWLKGQLRERPARFWIVLDHLDKVLLRQGVKDLLRLLASCVDERAELRLILLGYEHSNDFETDDFLYEVAHEAIPPIGDGELLDFFKSLYGQVDARYGTNHPLPQAAIDSTARVLAQVGSGAQQGLKTLRSETSAEVGRILAEAQA